MTATSAVLLKRDIFLRNSMPFSSTFTSGSEKKKSTVQETYELWLQKNYNSNSSIADALPKMAMILVLGLVGFLGYKNIYSSE